MSELPNGTSDTELSQDNHHKFVQALRNLPKVVKDSLPSKDKLDVRPGRVLGRGLVVLAMISTLQSPEDSFSLGSALGTADNVLRGAEKMLLALTNPQVQALTEEEVNSITGGLSVENLTIEVAATIPPNETQTQPEITPTMTDAERMMQAFSAPPGAGIAEGGVTPDPDTTRPTPTPDQFNAGLSFESEEDDRQSSFEPGLEPPPDDVPDEEIDQTEQEPTLIEYIFEPYYQTALVNRHRRLGLIEWDEHQLEQLGWKQITQASVYGTDTFVVPDATDQRFQPYYNPRLVAARHGIDVSRADWRQTQREDLERLADSGRLNILVAGLDTRPEDIDPELGFVGRADAMILVSIDMNSGDIALITLARDLLAPEIRSTLGGVDPELSLLTWVHQDEHGRLQPNPDEFTRGVVENATGLMVDGMVRLDFEVAADLVDALFPEGLVYDLTEDIPAQRNLDGFGLEAGQHVVNGDTVVKLIRVRYQVASGAEGRQNRLRHIMETMMQALVSEVKQNPASIPDIFSRLQAFFSVLDGAEANVADLNARRSHDPDKGYLQQARLAISPISMFERLFQADIAAGLGGLVLNQTNQTYLQRFRSGQAIQSISIGESETHNPAGFWADARSKVAANLGLDQQLIQPEAEELILSQPANQPESSETQPRMVRFESSQSETNLEIEASPPPVEDTPVQRELILRSDENIYDWFRSPQGPLGGVEISDAQINFIQDYLGKLGFSFDSVRTEDWDLAEQLTSIQEAHVLFQLAFPDGMGVAVADRTELGQRLINSQYATGDQKNQLLVDWHQFIDEHQEYASSVTNGEPVNNQRLSQNFLEYINRD